MVGIVVVVVVVVELVVGEVVELVVGVVVVEVELGDVLVVLVSLIVEVKEGVLATVFVAKAELGFVDERVETDSSEVLDVVVSGAIGCCDVCSIGAGVVSGAGSVAAFSVVVYASWVSAPISSITFLILVANVEICPLLETLLGFCKLNFFIKISVGFGGKNSQLLV